MFSITHKSKAEALKRKDEIEKRCEAGREKLNQIFSDKAALKINDAASVTIKSHKTLASEYLKDNLAVIHQYGLDVLIHKSNSEEIHREALKKCWNKLSDETKEELKTFYPSTQEQLDVLYACCDFEFPIFLEKNIPLPVNQKFDSCRNAIEHCDAILNNKFLYEGEREFLQTMIERRKNELAKENVIDITPAKLITLKSMLLEYDKPRLYEKITEAMSNSTFKYPHGRMPELYRNALAIVLYKMAKKKGVKDEQIYSVVSKIMNEVFSLKITPDILKAIRHR